MPDTFAPNINSEFSIFIREDDPLGLPEYRVEGQHDGFPAYELYINKKRVYEHDPVARSQNPLSLLPPMEWDTSDTDFQIVPLVPTDFNFTSSDRNSNPNDSNSTLINDLINGINEFFPNLENIIGNEIFGNEIPLIGDIFSSETEDSSTEPNNTIPQNSPTPQNVSENAKNPLNFIQQIQEAIVQKLQNLDADAGAEEIQKALTDALGTEGLNILKNIKNDSNSDEIKFDLELGSEQSIFNRPLAADFGLPNFGLQVGDGKESQLEVGLDYDFNFIFGVNKTTGEFIFETPETEDLKINLEALIPDLKLDGTLGFLKFDVTDEDTDDNSSNDGQDTDGDGVNPTKLDLSLVADLEGVEVKDFKRDGSADINLNLNTNIPGANFIPSISTDLNINWDFTNNISDPKIIFNNVQLDLGSFFNSFAKPILDVAQEITGTEPINTITNILGEDVPVINASLVDVARGAEKTGIGFLGKETVEFVKTALKIQEIIDSIPNDADGIKINLGSFPINGTEPQSADEKSTNLIIPQQVENPQPESLIKFNTILDENPKLKFPILTEPKDTVFNLLLGKPADLFQFDLPTLGLGFIYESPPIPIFGPLSVVIEGQAGAGASIGFGFDAEGLQQFRDGGFTNPELIARGFYVTSPEKPNFPAPLKPKEEQIKPKEEQNPVLGLGVGILADLGIELGVIRASVDAGVIGSTYLSLEEERTRIPDLNDLSCVFELNGSLDATLGAKLRIGFGPFSFRKRIEIVRKTLVDFEAGCSKSRRDNGQAVKDEQNILTLMTGKGNDFITVDYVSGTAGNETVDVNSYTIESAEDDGEEKPEATYKGVNSYSDIQKIEADGEKGNDRIELGDSVLTSALLKGGGGEDELEGGRGNDLLEGGKGDDYLFGGQGNDTLQGNEDNDFLEGGAGNDSIDGGDGFDSVSFSTASSRVDINLSLGTQNVADGDGGVDTLINIEQIEGSKFDDIIIGNDKDPSENNIGDVLDGLEGNDTLVGLKGDDLLIGGLGADRLEGGEGKDATSYLNSVAPMNVNLETGLVFSAGGEADGDVLIDIESIQATIYDDILIGNDDNNEFYGSEGDDEIIGGGGDDTLSGGGVRGFSPDMNLSPGEDLVSYKTSPNGVEVSLKNGKAKDGYGSEDTIEKAFEQKPGEELSEKPNSKYSSFENVEGSNFNDILLEGDIGNNKIEGLNGDDSLKGDQGNDTLIGGAGADNLDGGDGFDWADYSESPEAVFVDIAANFGANGHAQGDTFGKIDNISTVENLLGSDFADYLVGDNGDNKINPGLGNGTDIVDGLDGSDRLVIDYSRNDIGTGITGGYSNGSVENGSLFRNTSNEGNILDAVNFFGTEEIEVIGTIKDDEIYGGAGNDLIQVGAGNDTIYGGRGSNFILADDGNDLVIDQTDINRQFSDFSEDNFDNFIVLDGGRGIDTLSVDLSNKFDDIVLENTNTLVENPNQLLSLSDGSAISNFEIFKDIKTGTGNDKLTQFGRINNQFASGFGSDIVNPGLGFDIVDGGSNFSSTLITIPDFSNDLLILDYSVEDTGTGVFYFNVGDESGEGGSGKGGSVIPEDIVNSEQDLIKILDSNLLPEIAINNFLKGVYARAAADKTSLLDQIEFKNFERFNITGTSKGDSLLGRDGNDVLIGNDGNDILIGNYGSDILEGGNGDDVIVGSKSQLFGSEEIDTLTGGVGADHFWLGTDRFAYSGSNDNANNSYALITDFNSNEGDVIHLFGCSPDNPKIEYFLGNSPQGLPLGTAIFAKVNEKENLVAIVQGATNLFFNQNIILSQDSGCPEKAQLI